MFGKVSEVILRPFLRGFIIDFAWGVVKNLLNVVLFSIDGRQQVKYNDAYILK